jgi:hypothetical protein
MLCKCKDEQGNTPIMSCITQDIFWCKNCGRLLILNNGIKEWWENSSVSSSLILQDTLLYISLKNLMEDYLIFLNIPKMYNLPPSNAIN